MKLNRQRLMEIAGLSEDLSKTKGQYTFTSRDGVFSVLYRNQPVGDGDFDRGSDSFWLNHSSLDHQKSFDTWEDVINYYIENRIVKK